MTPAAQGTVAGWKPIPGASRYQISEAGEVSGPGRHGTALALRPGPTSRGYYKVTIKRDDGSTWTASIHRLVAMVFLPNPEGLGQVNHIDGNKLNNHASNLEWCSAAANTAHAKQSGLYLKGEKASLSRLTEDQVSLIWKGLRAGASKSRLAAEFRVSRATIGDIKQGRAWSWLTSGF